VYSVVTAAASGGLKERRLVMEVKRAGDIMIPLDKYPHIPYWFTMRQALAEMEHTEFDIGGRRSLPRVVLVFDEEYNLLGIVRRRDILRGIEPEFLAKLMGGGGKKKLLGKKEDLTGPEKITDSIKKSVERPVSDVMMRLESAVDIDDNIMEVASKIVDNNVSLIPVLKDGEVVGVVRTVELIHEIARAALDE
jgi:CBS domain-containing protein